MAPSSPSKARLGWFFLTPSECSLRALEFPVTLSNKLRFYLRSSRRTEVKHHSTLQRMWGGGKMEENRVFKNLPNPNPYTYK